MQEERKSIGGALLDVFDAGLTLVKSELRAVLRQVTNVIKAKGIGVVLLLSAVGPLLMGLIFLILAVFYGLIRLGLGAWAAALIIALVAFVLTGVMIALGLGRLNAEVPRDDEERFSMHPDQMTEDERLEAQYQAEQRAKREGGPAPAPVPPVPPAGAGQAVPVATAPGTTVVAVAGERAAGGVADGPAVPGGSVGVSRTGVRVDAAPNDRLTREARGSVVGHETRETLHGEESVPVYESQPDGSPTLYGSSLNKKIDGSDTHDAGAGGHGGHDKRHDPNIRRPVVLEDEPGIEVDTNPTFREDMKKEGY